jgi:hypothetical protein
MARTEWNLIDSRRRRRWGESVNTSCLLPLPRREPNERPALRVRLSGNGPAKKGKDFRTLFCEKFQCPPFEFERQLFQRCLHRHVLPFAAYLQRIHPQFFREDLGLIGDLATAASHAEVLTELNRFYGRNVRDRNWLRKRLSLRISGKRVLKLSRKLFRRR